MPSDSHRRTRNRLIRRALFTSVISRIAGILLQVISLPIAAVALGPEGFGVYAMIGAILAWMTLSNLGISQATTLNMAREIGSDLKEKSVDILSSSWTIALIISVTVTVLALTVIFFTPFPKVIFKNVASDTQSIYHALVLVCLIFVAMQHLSMFEAAQLAFQNQYKLNVATTIGTLMAAFAVYMTARYSASVLSILIAAHLPVLIMRLLNAQRVWLELRPRIIWPSTSSWIYMKRLIRDGINFVSGTSISNFLCHPYSIFIVGAFCSAVSTAAFAAVMNAIILASAVFGLIMTPFRGALPEAKQRADIPWIRHVYVVALVFNVSYGIAACLLLNIYGDWLFSVWYSGVIIPNRLLLDAAGLYVLCLAVEVTNFNFLASLGHVRPASQWMLGKAIASAFIVTVMAATELSDFTLWGLVAANTLFSLIPLGLKVLKLLRNACETLRVQ